MAKKKLVKPEKKAKHYYDWNECQKYIEAKYNCDIRDYARKFNCKKGKPTTSHDDVPYQDFWHWVLEHHDIHNGCFIDFSKSDFESNEYDWDGDWQKEIYKMYLDEFVDENGEIKFYVWW